ncbi:TPA: hypothetical protein N0F65_005849 [Lagenidium giganteum]|uniref:Uncharacterized protein n=1 Tax=Lagenidium giganteum TaxID=4803 RepID=A0AAV2YQP6_9STRA|nr:TPA: hypothetical protein N0F65_005849 [Lagenidium giganteum]
MKVKYSRSQGEVLVRKSSFFNRILERFGQRDAHAVRNLMVAGPDLQDTSTRAKPGYFSGVR